MSGYFSCIDVVSRDGIDLNGEPEGRSHQAAFVARETIPSETRGGGIDLNAEPRGRRRQAEFVPSETIRTNVRMVTRVGVEPQSAD